MFHRPVMSVPLNETFMYSAWSMVPDSILPRSIFFVLYIDTSHLFEYLYSYLI